MFSEDRLYQEDLRYIANFDIEWRELENTNVLITGATGLIGTVLVDALMYKNEKNDLQTKIYALSRNKQNAEKHFINYCDNNFFEVIHGDVTQRIAIEQKVDFIINLASNTHPALYSTEPIKTIDSIVNGTKNILEFAAEHQTKRIINASSVEVYGENRGDTEKFKEDYCGYINCNTLRAGYTEGKRVAEALGQAYVVEKNLDVITVRFGRVYGAPFLNTDTKSTTQFVCSAINNDDIVLKSEGKQEYSYVYVSDAVTAILLLLTKATNGEAYNVANDEVKTLREAAKILADINNREIVYEIPSDTEKIGFSVTQKAIMDSAKIKGLGWKAEYDLKSGLERTVEILRSQNGRST